MRDLENVGYWTKAASDLYQGEGKIIVVTMMKNEWDDFVKCSCRDKGK